MKNILLIGAGGHASSCVEVIQLEKKYKIVGYFDNSRKKLLNINFLGTDREIHKYVKRYKYLHISFASVDKVDSRMNIFNKAKKLNFIFPTIISPKSYISETSKISEGSIIFNNCLINANVKIGRNSIVNNNCTIEHDVEIGDNCNLAPGVILNGGVKLEDNIFIGSGTVVREGLRIKSGSIIGMGSVVVKEFKKKIYFNKLK